MISVIVLSLLSCIGGLLIGGLITGLWMRSRIVEARAGQKELEWLEKANERMQETFEALAGRALQASSDELIKRSREQIGAVVEPLRESLERLDGYIRDLEQKREGAYQGLQEQLRQLLRAQSELRDTTMVLTNALKTPTVRGRWGEVQLRRVVEMAGLVKYVAFDEQVSTHSGRPDMVVHLPQGGSLPVDAKVPLDAYLRAMEEIDEQERKERLRLHAKAVRDRIRELGQKRYWEQFARAPDFVVMFVPNEAFLAAAFEVDPSLYEYAMEQHVLLTTPVTLLALLKAVAYGWQQNQITENARQIAQQGQEIYKRLSTFIGHLERLHKSLNRAVEDFNKAIGSLERRVFPAIRRLKDLGVGQEALNVPENVNIQARLPAPPDNGGGKPEA